MKQFDFIRIMNIMNRYISSNKSINDIDERKRLNMVIYNILSNKSDKYDLD